MSDRNDHPQDTFDTLFLEDRQFSPTDEFRVRANMADPSIHERAQADPVAFWEERARDLHWFRNWDRALEWDPPFARWFVGGTLNACYNCLDRHIEGPRRNKAALIWEGEPGETRVYTYWTLYREVNKFANVLKKMGIKRGDRVALYLPMIPELPIAMLACARIGAVHSVVFGGFSAEALRERIEDLKAVLLITADGGYRRGGLVRLKDEADKALTGDTPVQNVIIVKRGDFHLRVHDRRDHWWHRLMQDADAHCPPEPMGAEDLLFVLYTSGTTGKPKGIMHTTGGYMTGVLTTTKWVFDIKLEDVYWCTADIGWITGHSYVVYGPLAAGATQVIYEGAPDWPERDRFWDIIERHGVNIFYTAPTAIRAFMKWGPEWVEKHDMSTLRLLGTVGEPINPEPWVWYHTHVGREKCPVVDTWWQTETGSICISPLPGLTTTKPGSATRPFPGIIPDILDEHGNSVKEGAGYLAILHPWPSMLRGIYGDPDRYVQQYWSKWKDKVYFTGDGARRDQDGNFWLLGRVDDVINIAGHRLSTMEVESALVDSPLVAEAAVVSMPHELKGESIAAFVTLMDGLEPSAIYHDELKAHVVEKIGKLARPEKIIFTADLPKTRSGKIMRRLLKDIATGKVLGDTTTLADASVVESLKRHYEED